MLCSLPMLAAPTAPRDAAALVAKPSPRPEAFAREQETGGCPAASPPRGVLYNHLGKTGGTYMKELLKAAMGASRSSNSNVSYVNIDGHVSGDSPLLGPDGALIIQDDVNKELRTTEADAASFFHIGMVRRPCDYMVSAWAFTSLGVRHTAHVNRIAESLHSRTPVAALSLVSHDKEAAHADAAMKSMAEMTYQEMMGVSDPNRLWGSSPPYDNDPDRSRFATWLSSAGDKRDAGKSWNDGSRFMSSHLEQRYDDPDVVHCWVRTHLMLDDLKKCMLQYGACGGKWAGPDSLSDERVVAAKKAADAGIAPSTYASCSSFFSNSTLMATVMHSEAKLIAKYKLDTCCSD